MHRLGPSHSAVSEWGEATGYYSRLTIGSASQIRRPIETYPKLRYTSTNSSRRPIPNVFRTECLDLGFVETQFELGNQYP